MLHNRLRNKKLTVYVTPTAYVIINQILIGNTYVIGLQLVNNVPVLCISFLVTFSLFAVRNCCFVFLNYFCDFGFDYFRDKVKGCGHCENLIHSHLANTDRLSYFRFFCIRF